MPSFSKSAIDTPTRLIVAVYAAARGATLLLRERQYAMRSIARAMFREDVASYRADEARAIWRCRERR